MRCHPKMKKSLFKTINAESWKVIFSSLDDIFYIYISQLHYFIHAHSANTRQKYINNVLDTILSDYDENAEDLSQLYYLNNIYLIDWENSSSDSPTKYIKYKIPKLYEFTVLIKLNYINNKLFLHNTCNLLLGFISINVNTKRQWDYVSYNLYMYANF